MSNIQEQKQIPIREAREIVKGLMVPNPLIYWFDFLFNIVLGWCSFYFCYNANLLSPIQWALFFVSIFSFYRAAIFIHEITHLRKGTFFLFRFIWNLLCGFPLMIPSFLYQGVHNDHHNVKLYGTRSDGEYFPFVNEGRWKIILFTLASFFVPVFFFLRFVFLTPLSYCSKSLRSFVLEKTSSFSINLNYQRTRSSLNTVAMWQAQEFIACFYGWIFIVLILEGVLPYKVLGLWFIIFGVVFFLNSLRTLVAHCYRYSGDKVLDISEQLLDSVNVPNSFLGVLWAPVGLRFHATHHLIPEMPYHSLGKAHQRLREQFSKKHLYIQTSSNGLFSTLIRLWRESGNFLLFILFVGYF
jgi:fatty acid desaturase